MHWRSEALLRQGAAPDGGLPGRGGASLSAILVEHPREHHRPRDRLELAEVALVSTTLHVALVIHAKAVVAELLLVGELDGVPCVLSFDGDVEPPLADVLAQEGRPVRDVILGLLLQGLGVHFRIVVHVRLEVGLADHVLDPAVVDIIVQKLLHNLDKEEAHLELGEPVLVQAPEPRRDVGQLEGLLVHLVQEQEERESSRRHQLPVWAAARDKDEREGVQQVGHRDELGVEVLDACVDQPPEETPHDHEDAPRRAQVDAHSPDDVHLPLDAVIDLLVKGLGGTDSEGNRAHEKVVHRRKQQGEDGLGDPDDDDQHRVEDDGGDIAALLDKEDQHQRHASRDRGKPVRLQGDLPLRGGGRVEKELAPDSEAAQSNISLQLRTGPWAIEPAAVLLGDLNRLLVPEGGLARALGAVRGAVAQLAGPGAAHARARLAVRVELVEWEVGPVIVVLRALAVTKTIPKALLFVDARAHDLIPIVPVAEAERAPLRHCLDGDNLPVDGFLHALNRLDVRFLVPVGIEVHRGVERSIGLARESRGHERNVPVLARAVVVLGENDLVIRVEHPSHLSARDPRARACDLGRHHWGRALAELHVRPLDDVARIVAAGIAGLALGPNRRVVDARVGRVDGLLRQGSAESCRRCHDRKP
mmetsp:Transcript_28277/g.69951  ORF Transcript_28277/g.69951 Transcript_28277/m.69951 type:complete len:646 (+) Transcript_28277:474-2411(+)